MLSNDWKGSEKGYYECYVSKSIPPVQEPLFQHKVADFSKTLSYLMRAGAALMNLLSPATMELKAPFSL